MKAKVNLHDGRVLEFDGEEYSAWSDLLKLIFRVISYPGEDDVLIPDDQSGEVMARAQKMLHKGQVVCKKVNGELWYAISKKAMKVMKTKLASMNDEEEGSHEGHEGHEGA